MKMSLISLVVCLVLSTYAGASHMLQVNDKQRLLQKVVTNKSSIWRSILNSHMRFKHKLTADQLASSKRLRPFSLAHCVPEGMRVVPVASGAYNMVVHHNDTISDIIESSGMLDETSVKDIADRINASFPDWGVFVDIGAGVGYQSLLYAKAGWHVIAVEPLRRNREALEGSLCLNPELRDRVRIVRDAVVAPEEASNSVCVVRSKHPGSRLGTGAVSCKPLADDDGCSVGEFFCEEVKGKTLDTVLQDMAPPRVDVVSMSVEERECEVLAGGQSLFTQYHPQLVQADTISATSEQCVQDAATKHRYKLRPFGIISTAMLQVPIK